MATASFPTVLCFSGLDPSGGAGIQADIEAIGYHQCHCAPIITANTIQNTRQVQRFEPLDAQFVFDQATYVLQDMPISAIKIGMLGNAAMAESVSKILQLCPDIPVIFDPVLAAGGGTSLAKTDLIKAILELIVPYTTVMTPNTLEAEALIGHAITATDDNTQATLQPLFNRGLNSLLLTGTHASSKQVHHYLLQQHQPAIEFTYTRLNHEYHGSGCTLASSLAAQLALGKPLDDACQLALDYTYQSLQLAQQLSHAETHGENTYNQLIPKRFF